MEQDETGDVYAIDKPTYCHAEKIEADAEKIEADISDKMEDDVNEESQSSPRRVEDGSAADLSHMSSREVADKRSIFVGGLGYDHPTKAEIKAFFGSCGEIQRVTIQAQHSSVHAFVQFTTREAVAEALKLDKKYLKDKPVTVRPKRTNWPDYRKYNPRYGIQGGRQSSKRRHMYTRSRDRFRENYGARYPRRWEDRGHRHTYPY